MTRINVIDPALLYRGHVVAEYEELPRVFLLVRDAQRRGITAATHEGPPAYVLGPGHLKFFYTRLAYLRRRYWQLGFELVARGEGGARLTLPDWTRDLDPGWYGDYVPTPEAVRINKNRINQRLVELGLTEHLLRD